MVYLFVKNFLILKDFNNFLFKKFAVLLTLKENLGTGGGKWFLLIYKIVKCTNMTQFNKIIKNGVVTITEGEKLNLYISIFKEFQVKKFQIK